MNLQAVKSIYQFEMARAFRTVGQSILSPVISWTFHRLYDLVRLVHG